MKKRMLADVLREAADVHLWDGRGEAEFGPLRDLFSCNAICFALGKPRGIHCGHPAFDFVRECGCNGSALQMDRVMRGIGQIDDKTLQGARFMWLHLAAHVAEDENIQIEVPA